MRNKLALTGVSNNPGRVLVRCISENLDEITRLFPGGIRAVYSNLELQMYEEQIGSTGGNEAQKRKRGAYYKLPLFIRSHLYFWYRYYFQLGFLDGKEGKIFAFLQAYWFRFVVDAKIYEQQKSKSEMEYL